MARRVLDDGYVVLRVVVGEDTDVAVEDGLWLATADHHCQTWDMVFLALEITEINGENIWLQVQTRGPPDLGYRDFWDFILDDVGIEGRFTCSWYVLQESNNKFETVGPGRFLRVQKASIPRRIWTGTDGETLLTEERGKLEKFKKAQDKKPGRQNTNRAPRAPPQQH